MLSFLLNWFFVCLCFADFQTPLTPFTPNARISALNIVGDLLHKLGVSFLLVLFN